jgi:fatty-acyl-CoA synthase
MTRPLVYTDALAAQGAQIPGRAALIDASGAVTYGQVWESATRIARSLGRLGIGRGEMVVVAMEPSATQAVAILGVMAAGAVACPLNIRLAPPEVLEFLGPLQPRLALLAERHSGLLATVALERLVIRDDADHAAIAKALEDLAGGRAAATTLPALDEDQPALVVATGGTTGVPKAATYSQRVLWAWSAVSGQIQEMRQDDVQLYLAPFFHSTIVTNLLTPLFLGATIRVLPGYDEAAIVAALNADELTWLYAAPTVLVRLLEAPGLRRGRPGRLRVLAFGSMRAQAEMPDHLRQAFPGIRLITGYGTTEFGPVTRLKGDEIEGDPGCVGRPVPGARIEIRGPESEVRPRGEEGEMVVWCPWQMTGYWGRPDLTEAATVEGGIRPGDIGRFDERGFMHLIGRSKEAIRTGGENVWPAEVENALLVHPAVEDVLVYGVEDRVWGERVEAALVLAPGTQLGLEELRAFGRGLIASYKLPRSLRVLERIPLTHLNKPDRLALKRAAEREPLPDMV